jgi:secernin
MCDTFVSTPITSADGSMIMAKNSDREPNEAQNITFVPGIDHPAGSMVTCTYITIPQVDRTFSVLLSRPFWMFGAEMGVNEHGVAIGNEAVFTKEKYHKKNDALLGMDILRLALERSKTACEAHDLIISLIAEYGQGGNNAMGGKLFYHNSYLIADFNEAYLLETAGRFWVSKRVVGIASISNCLTIGSDFEDASPGLEVHGRRMGYVKGGRRLDFQRDFSDTIYTHFVKGRVRKTCSYELLLKRRGKITSRDMMRVLRYHNTEGPYRPGEKPMERICLHAGGLISSQSTGSMVAVLKKGAPPLVYFTGTSAPCVSLFKPHTILKKQKTFLACPEAAPSKFGGTDIYGSATNKYDRASLWWKGEKVHRTVLKEYARLMPEVKEFRDALEERIVPLIEHELTSGRHDKLQKLCYRYAGDLVCEQTALGNLVSNGYDKNNRSANVPWWFAAQWSMTNLKAGFRER